MSYQILTSKSGLETLKYKDQFLHSNYDPKREASRFIAGIEDLNQKQCVIVLGLGLAYHIEAIQENYPHLYILIIERNPEILDSLKKANRNKIIEKIPLAILNDKELKIWLGKSIKENQSESIYILEHTASINIDVDYYNKVKESIAEIQKYKLQSFLTSLGFSKRWNENVIKNLRYIIRKIKDNHCFCLNTSTKKPVLIIGSGPSLDKEIELIKTMQNRAYLIALAPSYHRLLKEGITPNFVISVEGGIANRLHLHENDQSEAVLIAPLTLNPHLLRVWKGKVIFFNHLLDIENYFLKDDLSIPMQGNVALAAFNFAQVLTQGPLIFMGLDFGFVHNLYHYKGNRLEDRLIFQSKRVKSLDQQVFSLLHSFKNNSLYPNFSGGKVKSNMAMLSYLKWLEDALQVDDRNYYSFDKYGAKIQGVQLIRENEIENLFPVIVKDDELIKENSNLLNNLPQKIKELLDQIRHFNSFCQEKEFGIESLTFLQKINNIEIQEALKFALSRLIRKQVKKLNWNEEDRLTLESSLTKWIKELESVLLEAEYFNYKTT